MSTPTRARKEESTQQHEQAAHLIERLKEELAGVEIARVEVSEAERRGRRLTLTVTVEEAEEQNRREESEEAENEATEQKSWSEEDPEGFEEAVEYLLEKNRELYQRLS